jgi:hypothetical protein
MFACIGETARDNRDCISKLRNLSQLVANCAHAALAEIVSAQVAAIEPDATGDLMLRGAGDISITLTRRKNDVGSPFLPFRPLVYGGDDLTFVCDARIGLWLTRTYLSAFERHSAAQIAASPLAELLVTPAFSACAGVATVRAHYPFSRAYDLADALADNSKRYKAQHAITGSCMDWHFAFSGLSGDIDDIREREYTVRAGSLCRRPVCFEAPQSGRNTWEEIARALGDFQSEAWRDRRGKVKSLREALRDGPNAVIQFRSKFSEGGLLPDINGNSNEAHKNGWDGDTCAYFDAIELVDLYLDPAMAALSQTTGGHAR